MNIVTKSGTNDFHGSWFTNFRDTVAQREDQDREDRQPADEAASTSGISTAARSAARSCRTRRTSSPPTSARSRTRRSRSTRSGSSRTRTASSRRRCARTCSRPRPRRTSTPTQYLSVRYGRNTNSQVYGATTRRVPDSWGDSENTLQLDQRQPQLGRSAASKLNEFVFQFADFGNNVAARTADAAGDLPERRHHRLQHQHAADDRAAQVPVPRRLLVARRPAWAASATTSRPASTTSTSRAST